MPHRLNLAAPTRPTASFAAAGLALALSACGGGGEEDTTQYTLSGTVSSLSTPGLILSNGSSNAVSVGAAQTTFTFGTSQTGRYDVKVSQQPTGQTCSVSNGTGSGGSNVSTVAVTCRAYALFVANELSNTLSEFSVGTDGSLTPASTPTIPTLNSPTSIAVTNDGTRAWVSYGANTANSATISNLLISSSGLLSTQGTTSNGATSSYALAVSPDGNNLYSADYGGQTVSQFSINGSGIATPLSAATVAAGISPYAIATTPDGAHVYVANQSQSNQGGNSISCYSRNSNGALAPLSTPNISVGSYGSAPQALAVDPTGGYLYVTLALSAKVLVFQIDSGTGALTYRTSQATGVTPNSIAVSGTHVYVANYASNTLSQYVRSGNALAPLSPATVATGTNPTQIAISPDGAHLYVSNSAGGSISQFSIGSSDGVLSPLSTPTVSTGNGPFGIVVR